MSDIPVCLQVENEDKPVPQLSRQPYSTKKGILPKYYALLVPTVLFITIIACAAMILSNGHYKKRGFSDGLWQISVLGYHDPERIVFGIGFIIAAMMFLRLSSSVREIHYMLLSDDRLNLALLRLITYVTALGGISACIIPGSGYQVEHLTAAAIFFGGLVIWMSLGTFVWFHVYWKCDLSQFIRDNNHTSEYRLLDHKRHSFLRRKGLAAKFACVGVSWTAVVVISIKALVEFFKQNPLNMNPIVVCEYVMAASSMAYMTSLYGDIDHFYDLVQLIEHTATLRT